MSLEDRSTARIVGLSLFGIQMGCIMLMVLGS
jgi:hypothetical protein